MKKFNAFKFFFGLIVAIGFLLFSGITFFVDADLTRKLAHLTVQLVFIAPVALLVTRLRAKSVGLTFWPKYVPRERVTPLSTFQPAAQACTCGSECPNLVELNKVKRKLKRKSDELGQLQLEPHWTTYMDM